MRALVHSGGGSKGAYGAGALKHLLGNLEIKYDIFCGVSVGAINCAFLSQFEEGQEKESAAQLVNLWSKLETKDIYQRWKPFGKWHALWRPSFYDSSPLNKLIKKNIFLEKIRKSKKHVSVGTVSLNSGKYHIINQDNNNFIDYVIGSASFPGMLSPVEIDGHLWSDGGVKEISPLRTAIDMGATEIDVIITSPEKRVKLFIDKPTTIDILKRAIDLSTDKIMANDIEKVYMYNTLAGKGDPDRRMVKLTIIRPKHNLIKDLLDFSPSKIKEMMEKGYQDAVSNFKI